MQPLTVRDLFALYLKHAKHTGALTPQAIRQRERTLEEFAKRHGDMPVSDLRSYHLTDFICDHPAWKASGTRKRVAGEVKAVFGWAVEQERIDRHPFRRVRYAASERRPEMPDDVLARLVEAAGPVFAPVLRFLRLTGCRIGELCAAQWGDVDLQRGVWTVHRHKGRKATGKAKVVVLVAEAVGLLRSLAKQLATASLASPFSVPVATMTANTDVVFVNSRGTPWTPALCRQRLARLKRRLRIKGFSIHGIRHACATAAVRNGAPIKFVSMLLGHRTTAVTEAFYVSLENDLESIRAAAEAAVPRFERATHG